MHNIRILLNLGFLRINRLSFSIHPTLQVLDIGCGTGGSAFFIARHYGCSVRGLDMSPTMIAIANEYRQSHTDNYSQIITYRFTVRCCTNKTVYSKTRVLGMTPNWLVLLSNIELSLKLWRTQRMQDSIKTATTSYSGKQTSNFCLSNRNLKGQYLQK